MSEYPKHIKKLIRYYATLAHEEELRRALESLAAKFDEWRAGNLGSHELSQTIREFDQGPSRDLFKRYNEPYFPHDLAVAHAIATGVLDEKRLESELLELLTPAIRSYREKR